jgi:hypothetical protein
VIDADTFEPYRDPARAFAVATHQSHAMEVLLDFE